MAQLPPSDTALRVSDLSQTAQNVFALRPDTVKLKQIAEELGFSGLRKLSFEGQIKPVGASDWVLTGKLGATVVQPCVVTLDPVTTRIDTEVLRQFIRDYEDPDEAEMEMPDDDSTEALGAWIDPGAVMLEALVLAAPDYPRKETAQVGELIFTKPGAAPMTDEDARPFAGLADLKSKLENGEK